jgi:hypothetical protein
VTLTHLQAAAAATGILLLLVIAGTVAVTLLMLALVTLGVEAVATMQAVVKVMAKPVACEYNSHLGLNALTVR